MSRRSEKSPIAGKSCLLSSEAAAAVTVVSAAVAAECSLSAAVSREGNGCGRLYNVRRRRTLRAGASENIRLVRFHSRHKHRVLIRLRSRETESLIFALERGNLVLTQIVEDSPCARVLTVDNVTGVVVHSVLESASVGSHVVINVVNSPLSSAAAVRKLT